MPELRGEKVDRNLRMLEDSNVLTTRELAAKYDISPARVYTIVSKLRSLQEDKPDRVITAIQQAEDRLVAISASTDLALRDLRSLRRLVESVNKVSSKDTLDR